MGLRAKLLVTLFALLLLLLVVLSGGAYWFLAGKLSDESLSYQRNIAGQLVIGARSEISSITAALRQLSESTALISQLEVDEPAESWRSALQVSFSQFLQNTNGISQVALYDARGRYLLHAPASQPPARRRLEPELVQQPPGDLDLMRRFYTDAAGQRWLQVLAPVYARPAGGADAVPDARRLLGYTTAMADLAPLRQMIEENDSPVTRLFFSDNYGDFLVKSSSLPVDALPVTEMRGLGSERDQYQYIDLEVEGVNYRLDLQPVMSDLWLGSMVDQDAIVRSSLSLLIVLLPAAVVVFALIALIFYLQLERLVLKPISALTQATRRISAGEYLPDIDIHSHDELGELAQAFRAMGSQLEDSSQQVNRLAYYDPLTKLPNRTTLKLTLGKMIEEARRNQRKLAVLFIDLDDFKKVNDRLGHAAGDELLVQVGRRLQQRLRTGDLLVDTAPDKLPEPVVSRRGGDEFNAILNNVHSPREAALVAERMIADINEPVLIHGSPVTVGASIGVALFPDDGEDVETLLRHADMAMYEAKALGKNKYSLFTEAINIQVHERLELEHSIARGLQCNEFEVYYQPRIDLQNRQVSGFEALIRWKSPERGMVSPAEFIPLAEESQLIHDLGHWMMAETLHQLHAWLPLLPPGIRIAINISARQMAQENFAEHLISLAEQFEVPLKRLEIELTETSILTDEMLVRQHLYALRTVGVKVSLDDFGTGYSSLTFLRNLPIDAVKIDRSFVMRLQADDESRAIVVSVLDLCAQLALETVAEGIETPEQLELLCQHGCDEGQGYLFARPMPADQVPGYLRQQTGG